MTISFFEEFPIKDNFKRLELINFPTKLYVAAKNLSEFKAIKKNIKNKYVKEIIYWPILKKKEGYWISPFSERKALLRMFNELKDKKDSVMLDLELPTTKNFFLYLTQFFNFLRNKKKIRDFINNYQGKVYLAEYYPNGKIGETFLKLLGLHYKSEKPYILKMFYHSMHDFNEEFFDKEMKRGIKEFKDRFIPCFGTIAVGIQENEPILSAKQLEKDLTTAKKHKCREVIIFRLGGLNEKYVKVLERMR